jgi:tRNA(adenine34) deaminase
VNYEFFMRAALAEARAAMAAGERAEGAVAVMDEALLAHGREQVRASGDPTAHAVVQVVREACRRLRRSSLSGITVFSAVEPCALCVGALLASDADGLVYAVPDPLEGAVTSAVALTDGTRLPRRLRVVSGILQEEAAELHGRASSASPARAARGPSLATG